MKLYNRIILASIAPAMFAACADDPMSGFDVAKPEKIAQYEYLNQYGPLKSYINRTNVGTDFKFAAGVSIAEFTKHELQYSLTRENFDEVTLGNGMKYSSCVNANGAMDFGSVSTFVDDARNADVSVFGHTLCWHSQQQKKYLEGLVADKKIEVDPDAPANNYIEYTCGTAGSNPWDKQGIFTLPVAMEKGANYTLTVDIKASETCDCALWPLWSTSTNLNQWNMSNDVQYCDTYSIGNKWATYTWTFNANFPHDRLQFSFGKHGGTIGFDNLVLVKDGTENNMVTNGDFAKESTQGWSNNYNGPSFAIAKEGAVPAAYYEPLIANGSAEDADVTNFLSTEIKNGPKGVTIGAAGTGADGVGHAFVIKSGDDPEKEYDTQFFIKSNSVLKVGDVCKLKFKYRADIGDAPCSSQAHTTPGGYIYYAAGVDVTFGKEWQTLEKEFTVTETLVGITSESPTAKEFQTIVFNLSVFKNANTYYFDDIEFGLKKEGNTIPLTAEEKKEVLTNELERWIKGMMGACDGYVTAWDVVNEPLSDGNTSELKSADNQDAEAAASSFYWQDYLGKDYARTAIRFARQYGPENMKLFINEYNLEAAYNKNAKCEGLINMINYWESDGVTKIDGIGSQMHVSYCTNADEQKSQEEAVVRMYQLLAATGKLVHVSELDMGIKDENGKTMMTTDVTFEQYKAMADYWKFIITKYFEIIPKEQQYGIVAWGMTDSPSNENSHWRRGEPIGIWSENYDRKPVYEGIVKALETTK